MDEARREDNALQIIVGGGLAQKYTAVQLAGLKNPSQKTFQAAIVFFGLDQQPLFLVAEESNLTAAEVAEGIQPLEIPDLTMPKREWFINLAGLNKRQQEEAALVVAAAIVGDVDVPVGIVAYLHDGQRAVSQRLWLPRFFPPVVLWRALRTVARDAYL